ncbi:MAG: response regulator [Ignavibacteriales bacterium]|nr:response regulator [Ignavibacteriales bacterium]
MNLDSDNLHAVIFNLNKNKFCVAIILHKILPAIEDRQKYLAIFEFVKSQLLIWQNEDKIKLNKPAENELVFSSIKGLEKEIKTINGLLTLAKEENPTNGVNKYLDQIKKSHQFISASLDDLNESLSIQSKGLDHNKTSFGIKLFWDNLLAKKLEELPNCKIQLHNVSEKEISFDEKSLSKILNIAINFSADLTESNEVLIQSSITPSNKLHVSVISKNAKIKSEELISLQVPFSKRENIKTISGLSIQLIQQIVLQLNGTINYIIDGNDINTNISLPVGNDSPKSVHEILKNKSAADKDKILVIESDSASSTLLNNYLSKWNYQTEIVNSGEVALKLIHQNKYVAVILNVEQENDNSLELLQKIKNNKATRNTPVIVFSLEVEKEKIYLMGAVEYLVKPINYNNLVEILTSYKLRRNSTVLCVDDDQPTLSLVKQAVQTAGFNVLAEHRPELVLDLIMDKDLDLAIIDLDMPKLNGFDLIKKIKSDNKFSKLPIIIYTGKEDYQEDLQKIDGLFVDLLDKKSTSFNELENTITAMIKSYEDTKPIEQINEKSDSPTILMAEDYKHSQIIVTRLLKKNGYENVVVVENGEEALNICKKEKVDLILMDMQMPVMNGFEATGKIRELEGFADTPIIALTAFAMKGDREKCLEAGATDYIPKPIDSKEFIEKVKYYTQVKVEN